MLRETDSPERRIVKLERINAALMQRLARMEELRGSSYALTRTAAMLEREVLARNRDLEGALAKLSATNMELAAAREAADGANRAKSRFLRAASHDLLQPLSAAKLFLAHLAEITDEPVHADLIARVMASFESAEELIQALLDIGKLDSVRTEVSIAPLSIGRLFQRLETDLSPLAQARGVKLRFVPSSRTVLSDPVLLRSVAQNLVANALKYTTGPRVLVGMRMGDGGIWLEVHDTGPGIAPDDQERIFNEFERLSRSDQPGSGLGLSIVQRACARLGHRLDLKSALGRGSTFRVQLPLGEICLLPASHSSDPEQARAETAALSGRHVLVVENDEEMRIAFTFLLQSWGMRVTAAPGRAAALAVLNGDVPDVLLTDYHLDDGETGGETIVAIRRAARRDIPAIMVSAEPAEAIVRVATPLGAAVLEKPMTEAALRGALIAVCAAGQAAGEAAPGRCVS